jgi:hydroxymethylpyrimidine pyrophosphatase-like HAD family hydrolase
MIQRKMFYSIVQKENITGLKKQDGYEILVDGVKFNAYVSEIDRNVYILDPKNGIAVFVYRDNNWTLEHHEYVEKAKDEFIKRGVFEKWNEKRNKESYQLTIKIFNAYKKAESLLVQQRELVQREIKEDLEAAGNE